MVTVTKRSEYGDSLHFTDREWSFRGNKVPLPCKQLLLDLNPALLVLESMPTGTALLKWLHLC